MPNIGIRIKLASTGSGKWAESGGDASKFGLTASELLQALEKLDEKRIARLLTIDTLPYWFANYEDTTYPDCSHRSSTVLCQSKKDGIQCRFC